MVTQEIKKYLKEHGITIKWLSEATGIEYQKLANCFDTAKTRELRAEELIIICKVLNINPFELVA